MKIAERIQITGGRASGFDYMRVILAVTVVLLHTFKVAYGPTGDAIVTSGVLHPFARLILPLFFCLSGFLVAGSLERCRTLGSFLGLRVLRIFPALVVEVMLSAFILGPILTIFTLHGYFTNGLFWKYLLNVFGDIHYYLPGLFLNNPIQGMVNGQLWTVPYELRCYIVLALMALCGVVRHRAVSLIVIVLYTLGLLLRPILFHAPLPVDEAFPGSVLVLCFLAGLAIYLYRELVPWNGALAVGAAVLTLGFGGFMPHGEYLAPLPAAYLTVYLGLTNVPRVGVLRHADLSYGIYLYGFVVQQLVAAVLPWSHQWYWNALIALPLTTAVAGLSWHFIERPALDGRRGLYRIEDHYLTWRAQIAVKAMKRMPPVGEAR